MMRESVNPIGKHKLKIPSMYFLNKSLEIYMTKVKFVVIDPEVKYPQKNLIKIRRTALSKIESIMYRTITIHILISSYLNKFNFLAIVG